MHSNYLIIKIYLLLVFIFILISCSSTSYIERNNSNDESRYGYSKNSNSINLSELNKSSRNVIKEFIEVIGTNSKKKIFLYELADYINTPYQYGGETKNGMDCSGFTQTVYKNSLSVRLPRTAREQFKIGEKIGSKSELKFGDLVYFDTSNIHLPGHVGIFLDKDLFVHASFTRGVIISSLNNTYYTNRYIGATRIKIKRKTKN
ncbi:MAG: C40 family peptidase [Ignavibacteriae bacterium]|nr:C40 family peptidase [Ignavibacteriota bacterium]